MTEDQRKTGYGKKAKRRIKLLKLSEMYPERADDYKILIAALEADLRAASTCILCGRKLSDEAARERGIGSECMKKAEEHES